MTDDDTTDKTEEVREKVGEDGALGGDVDSDSGAVLTLDTDSDTADGEGEGEGDEPSDGGGEA